MPRSDKGFVLVMVLGAAILLAVLASGFSSTVRSYVRSSTTRIELARAQAIADGGINLALVDLATAQATPSATRRFEPGGATVACEASDGAILAIRIEDEAGKLNLNVANQIQLAALFEQLGAGPDEARLYADNVLDFRDGDDDARAGGSERTIYATLGTYASPKNSPFDQVSELSQVAGLPADIAAKAALQSTVHTSGASIYSWVRTPSGVSYVTHAIAARLPQQMKGYTLVQWRRGELGSESFWTVETGTLKRC